MPFSSDRALKKKVRVCVCVLVRKLSSQKKMDEDFFSVVFFFVNKRIEKDIFIFFRIAVGEISKMLLRYRHVYEKKKTLTSACCQFLIEPCPVYACVSVPDQTPVELHAHGSVFVFVFAQ